jgi:hypothetical protein
VQEVVEPGVGLRLHAQSPRQLRVQHLPGASHPPKLV